jgi:hypothetical protein
MQVAALTNLHLGSSLKSLLLAAVEAQSTRCPSMATQEIPT